MIFLGLFTHFLLTELAPVDSASKVSIYEWLVLLWVVCITMEETKQVDQMTVLMIRNRIMNMPGYSLPRDCHVTAAVSTVGSSETSKTSSVFSWSRGTARGPLYEHHWRKFEPEWQSTWYWYERLYFVLRLYRLELWLSDRWNKIDAVMLICYYTSVALRFTLPHVDFEIVRIMFSISLIIFYFRILRLGLHT